MTADEIRASVQRHRSPLVLHCIEDYLAGKRYPLELLRVDPSIYSPEIKGAADRRRHDSRGGRD